jgi:hypothetical protein
LPNEEGLEEPMLFTLSRSHVLGLWSAGIGFVTCAVLFAGARSILAKKAVHEEEGEETVLEQLVDILMNTCAMCFAWCILMGSRWAWMLSPVLGVHVHSIDGRIMLALVLSLGTFLVVWVLDKVDDALRRSSSDTKTAERAISSIIGAVSVLVGFTWEHSFDGAVTAVAALNEGHPRLMKFILGLCVFIFLLRPWRRYILKRSLQLQALKQERDDAKMAKEKHARNVIVPAPAEAPLIGKSDAACGSCF